MNPRSPTDIALDRHLSPVNKTASRVVSRGVHWQPMKKIQEVDSVNPPEFVKINPLSDQSALIRKSWNESRFTNCNWHDAGTFS